MTDEIVVVGGHWQHWRMAVVRTVHKSQVALPYSVLAGATMDNWYLAET